MTERPYLFGLPFDEFLDGDLDSVIDRIDPDVDRAEVQVWAPETDAQLLDRIPPADCIIDDLVERFLDDDGAEIDSPFHGDPTKDPCLLALANLLRQALARKVRWRWAGELVATHVVTWDGDEPLVDGEPRGGKREVAAS